MNETIDQKFKPSKTTAYSCQECEDTQFVQVPLENGLSGMKSCVCKTKRRLEHFNSKVPPKFQGADITTLEPIVEKHAKQVGLFQKVKANPFKSYLILGKNGAGKTWTGYAIAKNAMMSGRRTVVISMADLMNEFKRLEMKDNLDSWKPQVIAEDLSQNHTKWTLFIDEIEKTRVTEFTVEKFFNLINAASSFGHQIVATSNMTQLQLGEHFSKIDPVYGSSIMRRLTEGCTLVEMF